MASNLDLDPKLIDQVLQLSGERTRKAAVTTALKVYVARRLYQGLRELVGAFDWDYSFNYKAGRSR